MKFTATVIIVATGEADLQADNINVFTKAPMTIIYPVMSLGGEIEDLDAEARTLLNQVIAHNVVNRAVEQLKPEGVVSSGPVPITNTPPEEVN